MSEDEGISRELQLSIEDEEAAQTLRFAGARVECQYRTSPDCLGEAFPADMMEVAAFADLPGGPETMPVCPPCYRKDVAENG